MKILVALSLLTLCTFTTQEAQGYLRPMVPRVARSHSASVGKRQPAHAQYAAASYQLTSVTGRERFTTVHIFLAKW